MQDQRTPLRPLEQILSDLLQRMATAPSLVEANVAAGIALNELNRTDEEIIS
jgi:hypothetical protein